MLLSHSAVLLSHACRFCCVMACHMVCSYVVYCVVLVNKDVQEQKTNTYKNKGTVASPNMKRIQYTPEGRAAKSARVCCLAACFILPNSVLIAMPCGKGVPGSRKASNGQQASKQQAVRETKHQTAGKQATGSQGNQAPGSRKASTRQSGKPSAWLVAYE